MPPLKLLVIAVQSGVAFKSVFDTESLDSVWDSRQFLNRAHYLAQPSRSYQGDVDKRKLNRCRWDCCW